jgi:endogenous inhibitor of DNA gyrase (YacG/DUF329 family)
LRAVRTAARCPTCGKPTTAEVRPFCSKRCADIDLGRWLKESYRVPADDDAEQLEQEEDGAEERGSTGRRPTGQGS